MNNIKDRSIIVTLDMSRPDDKLVYKQVSSQVFLCLRDYDQKFSDFLYLTKAQAIVNALMKEHHHVDFYIWGGFEGVERVRIGISNFDEITEQDFPIEPIQIDFGKFSGKVTHRDILGSILGLGIDRGKVGDILLFENHSVVFLDKVISGFVISNLNKIGKNKITTSIPDMDIFFLPLDNYRIVNVKLDNPRLSNLISKSFNISRDDSSDLIKAKKITINWAIATKDTTNLLENQTISVRGYGKIIIQEVIENKFILHVYK